MLEASPIIMYYYYNYNCIIHQWSGCGWGWIGVGLDIQFHLELASKSIHCGCRRRQQSSIHCLSLPPNPFITRYQSNNDRSVLVSWWWIDGFMFMYLATHHPSSHLKISPVPENTCYFPWIRYDQFINPCKVQKAWPTHYLSSLAFHHVLLLLLQPFFVQPLYYHFFVLILFSWGYCYIILVEKKTKYFS